MSREASWLPQPLQARVEGLVPGQGHERQRARRDGAGGHQRRGLRHGLLDRVRVAHGRRGHPRRAQALQERRPGPRGAPPPWERPPRRAPCRSASRSGRMPRPAASSIMFRQTTNGTSISASWTASSSARRRFLASPTNTTAWARPVRRMSRVTRSSSEKGRKEDVAGRVDHVLGLPVHQDGAAGDLDRGPRVVGDVGVGPGERAEEGALAYVRVADEDDAQVNAPGRPAASACSWRARRPRDPGRRSRLMLPRICASEVVFVLGHPGRELARVPAAGGSRPALQQRPRPSARRGRRPSPP